MKIPFFSIAAVWMICLAMMLVAGFSFDSNAISINRFRQMPNEQVELTFASENGGIFKFETSNDMLSWQTATPAVVLRTANSYTAILGTTGTNKFFRVSLLVELP
jgi:hypothetical protein